MDDDAHLPGGLPERPDTATDDVHENLHKLGDDVFGDLTMNDDMHLVTSGYDDWGPSLGLVGDQELVDDAVADIHLAHEVHFVLNNKH